MRSTARALALVAFLAVARHAAAQAPATATAAAPAAKAGKAITPIDMKRWNSIRQTALSNDGKWFAYMVGPADSDGTIVLRGTDKGAMETRTAAGNGGGSIAISGDSKWLGYIVGPPRPAAGRGRGGATGRGAAVPADSARAPATAAPEIKFVLVNLATGKVKEFERIRRFAFNTEEAGWIVMQGAGDAGAAAGGGAAGAGRGGFGGGADAQSGGNADLLLYNIANDETFNMGRVAQYAFNRDGDVLAYTMSTPDQVGNGVQIRDMKTGATKSLESGRYLYTQLAWVDSSFALSVMRGKVDSVARDTVFSFEAFANFGPNGPTKRIVFDPTGREDFPVGWKIASERAPRYTIGLTAAFFGVRPAPKAPRNQPAGGRGASPVTGGAPGAGGTGAIPPGGRAGGAPAASAADSIPSLILWHYKDPRLQSQQIVQEQADRSINYLAEYRIAEDRFVKLADDTLRNVTLTNGDKFAYGMNAAPYEERASYTGRTYQDVYTVDVKTGARKLIQRRKPTSAMSTAPDGQHAIFWGRDANWWSLDLATGDSANITRGVAVSFANAEDDHNNLFPPAAGSRGWSKDNKYVLLYDGWDIWKVPVKPGEPAMNLTGDGRKNQVHYQNLYRFEPTRPAGAAGRGGRGGGLNLADGIDLTQPLYVATYGEWTKKEGIARVDPAQAGAKSLLSEDARFSVIKARDADTYLYTRQTFTEYPNYWVFGGSFTPGYRITDINPQVKDLAWSSGTKLINYTSTKGDKLQGALYLPANYEPGKQYPMLVTIYEKRSQGKNSFVSPSETRAPDPSLYTSRGYIVFDPDIVYKINDPGMSAVWCLIPAVKAAIATGMVDAKHVGLWGHSWGGYQTAFMVTQTDMFAAAIAGAPLTNMVSMYASIYWNSGGSDAAIFESSQGRFKGNFIENYDAYIRNSPVFHADKVRTPLMILANDKDGAVDFNQGVTYYNTLRQLGKEVVFLEYVGENHGLARPVNQKDYAVRMGEYFDHYLKGAPAPDWLKSGIPRLKMEDHLQARKDSAAKALEPVPAGSPPVAPPPTGGGGRR